MFKIVIVCALSSFLSLSFAYAACLSLTSDLVQYQESPKVSSLQSFLKDSGFLQASPNGYFGTLTLTAVKLYQKSVGLSPTGYVGSLTRTSIKKATCTQGEISTDALQSSQNGVCGSSHNKISPVIPQKGLCLTGSQSSISGSGPWYWTCGGTKGGEMVSCMTKVGKVSTLDSSVTANGYDIFVSLSGNDSWSGEIDFPNTQGTNGPLKTIPSAQHVARLKLAAMASSGMHIPIRIIIQPGVYTLTSPLVITPEDSGTQSAPVSYEAAIPGTVIISGGVTLIQKNNTITNNSVVFDSPLSLGTNYSGGGQLFVNGHRAVLAREPNDMSYFFITKPVALPNENNGAQGKSAFVPSPDALSFIRSLSDTDSKSAIVSILSSWTSSKHHMVTPYVPGSIQVTPPEKWAFLNMGLSQRYFIENTAKALDVSNEFIWNKDGIRYIPMSNEIGTKVNAVMPLLANLVIIAGDAANNKFVHDVNFKGLTFSYTRYQLPNSGFVDSQAALDAGVAILVDGAKNILIDHCTLSGVAGYGVWFRKGVTYSSVTNSTFTDLGAGGIQMGQTVEKTGDPNESGHNSAIDNRVSETGKIFPGAIGIWVGQGFDNIVSNNLIYNTTYSGISVGWRWGFADSFSGRNRITDNLLVNIGQGALSDMGGIYTLGNSPGTVVSGNVIREVRTYGGYGPAGSYGGWGIYNDEGTSNMVVENNVVVGTDSGAYHLHYGNSNTVQKNLFALGDKAEVRLTRVRPTTFSNPQVTLTDNYIIPSTPQPFDGVTQASDIVYTDNSLSLVTSQGVNTDITKCGKGCHSVPLSITTTSDPRGIAVTDLDPTSLSLVKKTIQNAGPRDLPNPASIVTVKSKLPLSKLAPSFDLSVDLSSSAIGSQPFDLHYQPVGDTSSIVLVSKVSAPKGRCLLFTDSPSMINKYDPHAYASVNYTAGSITGEFSLVIDANSDFVHEWRDSAQPFLVGPSLHITPLGVTVKGKVVAPIKVGEWNHFKITTALAGATNVWSLQVTDSTGKVTTVNNLSFGSAGWQKLQYIGFISNSSTNSSACLAEINFTKG